MPKITPLQTNFSAGELSPGLYLRLDTQQYRDGAKSLRNYRCLLEGGVIRRPGTHWRSTLAGDSRATEFVVNNTLKYVAVFSDARVDFFRRTPGGNLATAGSLTGCPWTGTTWQEIDFTQSANTMFVTHQTFRPQVILRTGLASWTRTPIAFFNGAGDRTQQPYFKFSADEVTLQPSATTGAITLTTSANVFVAGHVGLKFRYVGKEILITGVTDGTTAAGTVVEELPPTQIIELAAASMADSYIGAGSFEVGDVVVGTVSGAKGIVVAVDAGDDEITVVSTNGLTTFKAGTTPDEIVGPNGKNKAAAVTVTDPAAIKLWDQQMFSDVEGYPAVVELHRNRLLFAGHPLIGSAVIGSTPTNLYDFDVGDANDGDGFIETIGDAAAANIVRLHSAEQLIVLTDGGAYYVPETAQNPFVPSGLSFNKFGDDWPFTTRVRTVSMDGGVMMISESLVIKARPTGNQHAMWDAEVISLLASHLIKTPIDMAVCHGFDGGSETYGVIVNSDGTLTVMQSVESQKVRNFTPWGTAGLYLSVAAFSGTIYAIVRRTINSLTVYCLEQFSPALTLDAATNYADESALASASLVYGPGAAHVVVESGNYSLGTYPLSIQYVPPGPYRAGLFYDTDLETLPPVVELPGGHRTADLQRILSADIHVRTSARFAAQGYELSAYQLTDDLSQPPPWKEGPQHFGFLGWAKRPTIHITQPDPLPLTIDAIQMEVAV